MYRRIKYPIIACSTLVIVVLLTVIIHRAPDYLLYHDEVTKADCIIPLLGKEYIPRKKEAFRLIAEGFSQVLLIPPRYRLEHVTGKKEKIPIRVKEELSELSIDAYKEHPRFRWHENTHLELILAKEYMMSYGFTSAIIVSSPYHMRRVKILSEYVFPESSYRITCIPDRFEQRSNPWWLDRRSLIWVVKEYTKIGWFLVYHRFSELITVSIDYLSQLFK